MKSQLSAVRITVILFLTVTAAFASDWPQYRGQNQDGISKETLNPVLPAGGPKLLWKVPVNGYGSFAISGDKVFALTSRANKGEMRELCVALDAATGKELWAADVTRAEYKSPFVDLERQKDSDGPRSTPTVNDGKVYVYSTDAKLCCFDTKTGKELWRVDMLKDHAGRLPRRGNAESPVVDGELVFVAGGGPGESILAINKNSGQVVWKAEDKLMSYSTPVVTTILGERQVVFSLTDELMGLSVKDGKTLWSTNIPFPEDNYAQPIATEDKVYAACGDAVTSGLYKINNANGKFQAKAVWPTNWGNAPYLCTPVLWKGHLYGTFGLKENAAWKSFKNVEFQTGKLVWSEKGLGCSAGDIIVDDKLVILSEKGDIVIAFTDKTTHETRMIYEEAARFKAFDGKCYGTPAFSNGRLYIRSTKEGACYDLSAK